MTKTVDKATRKMLTPAERVAKLEADLAEARAKAEAKNQAQADKLVERRAALLEQIGERQAKVDAIEAELKGLGFEIDDHSVDDEPELPIDEPEAAVA